MKMYSVLPTRVRYDVFCDNGQYAIVCHEQLAFGEWRRWRQDCMT